MNRHFLGLGRANKDKKFVVTQGLEGQKIGIIGLGRTGSRIAAMVQVFKPASINYYSRKQHPDQEKELNITFLDLPSLLAESDVIFLCVSDEAKNLLGAEEISKMKQDSLLVSFMHPGIIDDSALSQALQKGLIRAISDYPIQGDLEKVPFDRWYCMNTSNTITEAGTKFISDMVVESMINLLATGEDQYKVN